MKENGNKKAQIAAVIFVVPPSVDERDVKILVVIITYILTFHFCIGHIDKLNKLVGQTL